MKRFLSRPDSSRGTVNAHSILRSVFVSGLAFGLTSTVACNHERGTAPAISNPVITISQGQHLELKPPQPIDFLFPPCCSRSSESRLLSDGECRWGVFTTDKATQEVHVVMPIHEPDPNAVGAL